MAESHESEDLGTSASSVSPPESEELVETVDDEEDEDELDDDEEESESVQLGFIEPYEKGSTRMFCGRDWSKWDGGRVGGQPVWLDPVNLPPPKALECIHCEEPMSFLLQIYCPLDEPARAYHRMIYLFVCSKGSCANKGSVVALRCQLARENSYYALDPKSKAPRNVKGPVLARLCVVCGQKGPLVCGSCKAESYCSKVHQKLAWRAGHKKGCQGKVGAAARPSSHKYPCVFPEFDVSVVDGSDVKDEEAEALAEKATAAVATATPGSDAERQELKKMRQKDLYQREGVDNSAIQDATTFRFFVETAAAPNQVLRYNRWSEGETGGGPLWVKTDGALLKGPSDMSSNNKGDEGSVGPDKCSCGAPRCFEFQVMPQLLHYLALDANAETSSETAAVGGGGASNKTIEAKETDAKAVLTEASAESTAKEVMPESPPPPAPDTSSPTPAPTPASTSASAAATAEVLRSLGSSNALDWGVLAVYTCTESCSTAEGNTYAREFVWRQPPL